MSQGQLEQQISHKLDKAFKSLIENTLYESPTQAFFISKDRSVNTLQANAHLLTSLIEFSRGQLSSYPINKMRNYFLVKAELSESLEDVFYSLRGLKVATTYAPFLAVDSLSNAHGTAQVTDYLGHQIKFKQELTKFDFTTTSAQVINMLPQAKLNPENGLINFVFLDGSQTFLNPGNYHIDMETRAGIRTSTRKPFTISAVEVVEFIRVRYEISGEVFHEGDFKGVASYPEPLNIKEDATDKTFLHMKVKLSQDVNSLYLVLKKVGSEQQPQLAVNAIADADNKIAFAFDSLDQVAGDYEMTLVAHAAGSEKVTWPLGSVSVWFKEGSATATNNHTPATFLPKSEIRASYPPPDKQGSQIVSGIVCAAIALCFFAYTARQFSLGVPLAKLNFMGSLLLLSLMVLLALVIAFWIGKINLIELGWTVVLTAPVTLFCLFKGL